MGMNEELQLLRNGGETALADLLSKYRDRPLRLIALQKQRSFLNLPACRTMAVVDRGSKD